MEEIHTEIISALSVKRLKNKIGELEITLKTIRELVDCNFVYEKDKISIDWRKTYFNLRKSIHFDIDQCFPDTKLY
jgi:hypothetical protein